ncbi:hypothetical protein AGLY_018141 [Aphis glycines]|uniref:HAT C-terminal dimerisation domain-containing protein n=1 Tax=Aphis glycines TaxID=307491 RepID=A0A6G0SUY7_APHGL|nr:hypothetical protein AGLY_018141 [Aphis glycines]
MLKYIQTNNSELNSIVEDEDEPREVSEQQTEQTIEKKDKFTVILRKYLKINPNNKDTSQQQDIMKSMSKSEKFSANNKKAKLITERIVEMIALDYQPISIVEDYGFKRVIAAAEDRYVLPSRKLLSQKLIPELYANKKKLLMTEIKMDLENIKSISFTFDLWSSQAQQSYISLTCHYLTNKFKLKNKTLGCSYFPGEHTGNAIYNKIKTMIAEWNIEIENSNSNISIFFVTDNARNISSALSHSGSNFEHISCTAHTLQLAIDDAVKESNMTDLLKRCKAIVTHYNHSNIASERLTETQKRLNLASHKLIQMVNTRWNSIYLMLQRMLEQKDAILIDLPKIKKGQLLFARDWNMIESYVILLKPVFEATKELSREDTPTLSMVLPIICTIEAKLNLFLTSMTQNPGTCFTENLLRSMCKRFDVYKENELLTKELENSNYSLWDILHQRSVSKESTTATSINEVTIEIENYLKLKNIDPIADPLKWWEENYQTFPHLLLVIFKFLGIPGTLVCSERLFSGSGLTVSSRRTRLSPFLAEYLVFLHNNL